MEPVGFGSLTITSLGALALAAFFAVNMGGSGMSPSFAGAYGAGILSRTRAACLFGGFVLLGAVLAGERVVTTLSRGIVPDGLLDPTMILIVFLASALSLFLANRLRVSVSTSSVTVCCLVSVGLFAKALNTATVGRIALFWVALPLVSYLLTYGLGRLVIPWETRPWVTRHAGWIRSLVILVGCYVAFSIGSNNVANAVGPLVGAGILDRLTGFLFIAPFFGLGGFLFRPILETVGKEITGLGVIGAGLNGLVVGSLLLVSSAFGVPEPMVMLGATSIMGIGSANHGHRFLVTHQVVRKIFVVWVISPLLAGALTFGLLHVVPGEGQVPRADPAGQSGSLERPSVGLDASENGQVRLAAGLPNMV